MALSSAQDIVIALETQTHSSSTRITLKGDGTAELRDSSGILRRQKVEVTAVNEIFERMLNLNFFELADVLDRGMTRHPESYQLTLRYADREHSVRFDGNRFAGDLQNVVAMVRVVAHYDSWEPKLPRDVIER